MLSYKHNRISIRAERTMLVTHLCPAIEESIDNDGSVRRYNSFGVMRERVHDDILHKKKNRDGDVRAPVRLLYARKKHS